MITDIDNHRILCLAGFLEDSKQLPDIRIKTHHAVVIIRALLTKLGVIDPHEGNGIHVTTGQWLGGQPVHRLDEGPVSIRIIDLQIKGSLG